MESAPRPTYTFTKAVSQPTFAGLPNTRREAPTRSRPAREQDASSVSNSSERITSTTNINIGQNRKNTLGTLTPPNNVEKKGVSSTPPPTPPRDDTTVTSPSIKRENAPPPNHPNNNSPGGHKITGGGSGNNVNNNNNMNNNMNNNSNMNNNNNNNNNPHPPQGGRGMNPSLRNGNLNGPFQRPPPKNNDNVRHINAPRSNEAETITSIGNIPHKPHPHALSRSGPPVPSRSSPNLTANYKPNKPPHSQPTNNANNNNINTPQHSNSNNNNNIHVSNNNNNGNSPNNGAMSGNNNNKPNLSLNLNALPNGNPPIGKSNSSNAVPSINISQLNNNNNNNNDNNNNSNPPTPKPQTPKRPPHNFVSANNAVPTNRPQNTSTPNLPISSSSPPPSSSPSTGGSVTPRPVAPRSPVLVKQSHSANDFRSLPRSPSAQTISHSPPSNLGAANGSSGSGSSGGGGGGTGTLRSSPQLGRSGPTRSNLANSLPKNVIVVAKQPSSNDSSQPKPPSRPAVPRRELADQYPIKISLPNDKIAILRCPKDVYPSEFVQTAVSKLKHEMQFNANDKYDISLPNNEKIDFTLPLIQNAYLKSCYDNQIIPTILIDTVGSKSRTVTMYIAKPIDNAEIARLVNNFEVQFLLPGGSNLNLSVRSDCSLSQLKETVCFEAQKNKKMLLMNYSLYLFKTFDKILLENENITIGNVPYISQCRKHCTTPKLILVQKRIDPFTSQEKKRALDVYKLVGKLVVTSASDEIEIENFRTTMARLRYLERKRKKGAGKARDRITLKLTNNINTKDLPKSIMGTIAFPLLDVKKTIIMQRDETADQFIERTFDKYYSKKLPHKLPSDFVLKVAGLKEFIFGDHNIFSFEYINNKLNKNEKVELVFTPRSEMDTNDEDEDDLLEEQWQQGGEEMLEVCTIKYDHLEITSETNAWDQKTHISLWELNERFRIRIIGVEYITNYYLSFARVQDAGYNLYIAAGLYFGGELLCPIQYTDIISVDYSPTWYQWLTYPIEIRNIPKATRLCFTLFATTKTIPSKKDLPIGWVNCLLITHSSELRMGVHSLNLWRDEKANPIGTCVQNPTLSSSSLFIEFDAYQLPVVFPEKDPHISCSDELIRHEDLPPEEAIYSLEKVDMIIRQDPLYLLSSDEKKLLWMHRKYCMANPHCLPKFLVSVPYYSRNSIYEMHRLLEKWEQLPPLDALELLDYRFADSKVREFAVKCLAKFEDADLQTYLLQLVQVLKYEPHHDCALARFLVRRALRSHRVGHVFFWYLKGEMHVPEIAERYGLLLECYLYGAGSYLYELLKQCEILNSLQVVANHIKTVNSNDRKDVLLNQLRKLDFPDKFQLPLNPSWEARSLIIEKCKYMDSKKLPLWLVFNNADSDGQPITVIFKSGDDLRQDMLTLQIIRIMDKLWKMEGLDLQLSPYGCISTGDEVGMIEVVLNSATTAAISRESGGAAGALKKSPIAHWLQAHNPSEAEYEAAVQRFIYSCAGYCVATYVLGIGDRHNDNIMVQKNGRLFHIDFGHFLGNFKKKFGVSRERAKFVFTPDFAYVMGGVTSPHFHRFVTLCCEAYNILRKHASKFINLLAMMLSTGIPELTKPKDIDYLRNNLCLDMEAGDAAASFVKQISASLDCKTTIVNNFIHILAH